MIDEQNHLVYRDVDEDKDIVFHDTKSITLSDYLSKHPIVKRSIFNEISVFDETSVLSDDFE